MKEGDLASVFQVIKSKGAAVSAFQWRKLREAALICPSIDPDLLISGSQLVPICFYYR